MLHKLAGTLILVALGAAGWSQVPLRLRFESEGAREVWIADALPTAPPSASLKTEATEIEIPIGQAGAQDRVFVWDKSTGNLAEKRVPELQKVQPFLLKAADYKFAFLVRVKIEYDGKAVAGASVAATAGGRRQEQLLGRYDQGQVAFYAIPAGPLKLEVRYKVGTETKSLPAQTFEVKLQRDQPEPTFSLQITDPVEVLEPSPPEPKPEPGTKGDVKTAPATKKPEPSTVGNVLVYLFGLAVAAGLIIGVLLWMKKNPKVVKDHLEQLGVQVPDPQVPPDDAPAPAPIAPQPQPKILLDAAAPVPLGHASVAPVPAVGVGIPAVLVGESGLRFAIEEGTSVVGREEGLPIAIVGETTVSRRHAELVSSGDRLTVKDLGSTNGTFVNGVRVDSEATLRIGDTIQFGSVRFRVEA
ncbi:MAG TPA: FHA domain-containing protein [Fimbriimonadaceae bacterium]|nr:FHA domain-containing protein [Fimbriimonadaceae bacterium]